MQNFQSQSTNGNVQYSIGSNNSLLRYFHTFNFETKQFFKSLVPCLLNMLVFFKGFAPFQKVFLRSSAVDDADSSIEL